MINNEFVKKMLTSGQIDWGEGIIDILSLRGILIPAPTFVEMVLKLNSNIDKALDALYDTGFYHGKELAVKAIGEGMFKIPPETLIHQYGTSGNIMGLGHWEWKEFNPESKKVIFTLKNSPFPEEFRKRNIKTKKGVDSLVLGMVAGMASAIFKTDVKAKEIKCELHGAPSCEMVIEGVKK